MKKILLLALLICSQITFSQQFNLVTPLNDTVSETSGLLFMNGKLITHNDSGNASELYEIDSITGLIARTVHISNAQNVDWEDITHDDNYIYIGDFGNNTGSRTDLKVYRISKNDFFNTVNDTVLADTIQFSYAEQTDFTPAPFATNFDAEAMISFEDSLYIFSKNWGNARSYVYALPKTPGTYSLSIIDSIETQGFVAGADYDSSSNTIVLVGYTFTSSFLFQLSAFSGTSFSSGDMNRYNLTLPNGYSYQTEGVCFSSSNYLYFSSETGQGGTTGLYSLALNSFVGYQLLENDTILVYPNPVRNKVTLNGDFTHVELYDSTGKMVLTTKQDHFSVRKLLPGNYSLYIYGNQLSIKKLIKK